MQAGVYQDHVAYAVATPRERRTAFAAIGAAVALAAIAYLSGVGGEVVLPGLAPVSPVSMTAMASTLFVTTVILRNQYRASSIPSFAFLGTAYGVAALFVALNTLVVTHLIPSAETRPEPQLSVWLWVAWHGLFTVLTAGYLWARGRMERPEYDADRRATFVRGYVALVGIVTGALLLATFLGAERLPVLVVGGRYTFAFHALVEQLLLGGGAVVLLVLVVKTRLRETTHLWLGAVLIALLLETLSVGEFSPAPLTIAWLIARVIGWYGVALYLAAQLRHLQELLTSYAAKASDLERQALRDALTGLYNRRGFDARFANALHDCERQTEAISLLLLDLDHFKLFNDHFGHVAGDDALRTISRTLADVANRPRDSVCRIGGEEFAVVLPATDAAGAMAVAERLREAIVRANVPHAPSAPFATLTMSIGVTTLVARGVPATTALLAYAEADAALYRAKSGGRNRIARATRGAGSVLALRAS